MNIFKKISAAVLAAALTAATSITASASSQNRYYRFQTGHTDTQNVFLVSPVPENALECDEITLYTEFTTVKAENGDLKYNHSHQYQVIGWIERGKAGSGYWSVYDRESRKYLTGAGGNMGFIQDSDGSRALAFFADFSNTYIDDIFNNSNAVQVGIMGTKNGQDLWYLPDGSTSAEQVTCFILLKDPNSEPATSEPVTSEPATSEPATSDPITSEPVTSEPTTSKPVTSEPTTSEPATSEPTTSKPTASEPATSEPTTSEPATSKPTTNDPTTPEPTTSELTTSKPATSEPASSENLSNENNPATGFGMAILPIALLGGASIVVLRKRK